jgi:starch synthase
VEARLFRAVLQGEEFYLVEGDPVLDAEGVYGDPGKDAQKFTFAALASLSFVRKGGWRPSVLHAHDWHAAPAVVWLERNRAAGNALSEVASLLTVHNLPYMGAGAEESLARYGLARARAPALPAWARHVPLPMGLASADWINTVSPTYAKEILSPEFGCGLEGFLRTRAQRLSGILNGLDLDRWNPAADEAVAVPFSRDRLARRSENRRGLEAELGFESDPTIPLIGMVTRLDRQKGVDLALAALDSLVGRPWRFVLLGTGDPTLEDKARAFADQHVRRARFLPHFDARLARRLYAGLDMTLVPSRYEPCGLTQMIAMRYGCVPIVAATGGLSDTVLDYDEDRRGTGFVFSPTTAEALTLRVARALEVFRDRRRWSGLQRRGMAQDFSWDRSARQYLEIYGRIRAERVAG